MRVLIVQQVIPHYRASFFRGLAQAGAEVVVCADARFRGAPDTVDAGELQPAVWRHRAAVRLGPFFVQPGVAVDVARDPADAVVLSWTARSLDMPIHLAIARLRSKRVYLWGHANESGSRGALRYRTWLARRATGVLAYSHRDARDLQRLGLRRVFAVPNALAPITGVRVSAQSRANRDPDAESVRGLYLGRLIANKRLDLAIKALSLLPERFRLLIVGDGPEGIVLRRECQVLGLTDRVTFLPGTYDASEVSGYFDAADFFVIPQGAGLSVNTALMHGCPVVTTADPRVNFPEHDILEDGVNSLLVAESSAEAFAEKIGRLGRDSLLRAQLGDQGRSTVENLTMDAMVSSMLNALED
jgi:glycosyltransferase involved in cell wall biosynthesis